MKVTIVIDDGIKPEDRSVSQKRWKQVAAALIQREIEVTVATVRDRSDFHDALQDEGCTAFALSPGHHLRPAKAVRRLAAHLIRTPDSVIHGQEALPTLLAASAGVLARNPRRIYHRHHVFSSPRHARVSRLAAKLSTQTIAVSRAVADAAMADDRTPDDRVAVAFNGMGQLRKVSEQEIVALRGRLSLPEGRVAVCVSRLRQEKGLDVLITAAQLLPSSSAVVIVGTGPEEDALRGQATLVPPGARVVFAGHQSDVAPFYGLADLVVLPSRRDACPSAAGEAMSLGVPIVGTTVGGIPELVSSGYSGLLVPPGNARELAAAMISLFESDEHRFRFGQAGLHRYRSDFSLDVMADSWVEIYRSMEGRGRRRGAGGDRR